MRVDRGAPTAEVILLDGLVCVYSHQCSKVEDTSVAKQAELATVSDQINPQGLPAKLQLVEKEEIVLPESGDNQELDPDFILSESEEESSPLPESQDDEESTILQDLEEQYLSSTSDENDEQALSADTHDEEDIESFAKFLLSHNDKAQLPTKDRDGLHAQSVRDPKSLKQNEESPSIDPTESDLETPSLPEVYEADLSHQQKLTESAQKQRAPQEPSSRAQAAMTLSAPSKSQVQHPQSFSMRGRQESAAEERHFSHGRTVTDSLRAAKKTHQVRGHDPLSLFFRAHNDEKLFNLGESFYRDYKNGQRSFGFANVGSSEPQKRSILGIASFIRYFEENNVLVLTDRIEGSFFHDIFLVGSSQTRSVPGTELFYTSLEYHGMHFIQVSQLAAELRNSKGKVKPQMVHAIFDEYDVVFSDLPSIEARKDFYDVYLPVLKTLDHVTLVISLRQSRFTEINELKKYFASYRIPFKGSVIESDKALERRPNL